MPSNPWLAIDAATSPVTRARESRRLWDDFVGNGQLEAVRAPIAESWQRSRGAGIDPARSRAPTVADRADVVAHWQDHPLVTAAPLVREWLGPIADESDHVIVVSDADGLLLWIEGNPKVRSAAADSMNFVEGALWSEGGAGTNAIGTALAADHPVQVHAAEHFSEVVHGWTCSAAPVHDPETGRLLGIVDLTGRMRTAHPHSFAVALATAHVVEADLRARLHEHDAQLRSRYLSKIATGSGRRALATPTGRVIAEHPVGFLRTERLDIPLGGGDLILSSGLRAFAEPVGGNEAFIVHVLPGAHDSRGWLDLAATPADVERPSNGVGHDVTERRAQIELSRVNEEQSALRRVAMLVAGRAAANEIFAAVAKEVASLLRANRAAVSRYESDDSITVAGYWSEDETTIPVGTRVSLKGDSATVAVRNSGRPIRIDSYDGLAGPIVAYTRTLGPLPRSTVGAPIIVDGRIWGAIFASSMKSEPFPDDTESRMMGFTELAATAISNAVGRTELAASRARIVATADETRRQIERDLHDGAQQRLVSLALELRAAAAKVPWELAELRTELSHTASGLAAAVEELHEISRGIHPAILSEGGLGPALKVVCRRSAVPVELHMPDDRRLPESIEVAAYYVVSEALTNVAKHARATAVRVDVEIQADILQLAIRDDGIGGADTGRGSGLIGLRDRVDAVGGTIAVDSPAGAGTSLLVALPIG